MKHGTEWAYHEGCRCAPCRSAMIAVRGRRCKTGPTVAAGPIRDHILFLTRRGVSRSSIATMCGIGHNTADHIVSGATRRVTPRVAELILGVSIDSLPDTGRTPAWRVQRLSAEIARCGVTRPELANMLRQSPRTTECVLGPVNTSRRTLDRFVTIYRYLAGQGIVPASVLEEVA